MENIKLNSKTLRARELTAREVKKVIDNLSSEEIHTFELIFPNEPVPALGMAMSLDIGSDELLDLTRTQMLTLLGEVKKKNPLLVQVVEALRGLCQKIIAEESGAREAGQTASSTSIH